MARICRRSARYCESCTKSSSPPRQSARQHCTRGSRNLSPCKDRTKLLLTLRQWLSDLRAFAVRRSAFHRFSRSVSSALLQVKKLEISMRAPKCMKCQRSKRIVKLERSGGLDYLVGSGEERSAFPRDSHTCLSVDGRYCRINNMSIEHFRGGHLEFDPGCTTCTFMTRRGLQHRRQAEEETADTTREVCADQTGRLPTPYSGSEYPLAALRRETHFGFVRALSNKRSETIREAMVDMPLLVRECWRFHSDERRESVSAVVLHSTTGACDPDANNLVGECVGARKRGIRSLLLRSLLHQANAPVCLTPDAAEHTNGKQPIPGQNYAVEPIVL